jgi:hypothetical protein
MTVLVKKLILKRKWNNYGTCNPEARGLPAKKKIENQKLLFKKTEK